MAVRDTATVVADGDQLDDGYFNGLYYATTRIIGSVYTDTGFDSSQSGNGTNSDDHTIQLTSGDIAGLNYVIAHITFKAECASGGSSSCTLRVERNETGQASWSDVFPSSTICYAITENTGDAGAGIGTLSLIITLTAGEKTNGIDIKISTSSIVGTSGSASVSNVQVYFSRMV